MNDQDWDRVKKIIRNSDPNTYGLVNACKEITMENGVLTMRFASDVLCNQMAKPKNKELLQLVLLEFAGINYEIKIINKNGNNAILPKDNGENKNSLPKYIVPPDDERSEIYKAFKLLEEYARVLELNNLGTVEFIIHRGEGGWRVLIDEEVLDILPTKQYIKLQKLLSSQTFFGAVKECLTRRNNAKVSNKSINYQEYIQSPEWKEKAKQAKEQAGWRCQLCYKHNDDKPLHAHHRTYQNLGNEQPGDITVLCADCHAKFHNKGAA